MGNLLDILVFGEVVVLRRAIIFFYLQEEGLSLIKNSTYLGLPIPEVLHKVLEHYHKRRSGENDNEDDGN